METLLLGLEPPSNVERILNDAKQDLFSSFASVSAIALGPVIPLRYEPAPVEPPAARGLPHGLVLETGDWRFFEGTLMLSVEPADRVAQLSRALGEEPGMNAPSPLPLFPGIYIACPAESTRRARWPTAEPEAHYDAGDMVRRLGPPPRVRWSVSELVCWRIELAAPQRWWDDVRCEVLWRIRLRKGASRTP